MPVITDAELDSLNTYVAKVGNLNHSGAVDIAVALRQLLIGIQGREVRSNQQRNDGARYLPYSINGKEADEGIRARVVYYITGHPETTFESAELASKEIRLNKLAEAVRSTVGDNLDCGDLSMEGARQIVKHLAHEFDVEL